MDSITKGFFSSFTFNGCRRCCCSCPKVDKQPLTHSHTPIDSRWQLLLQHPFVTKHKKSLKRASERRSLAASSSSCFFCLLPSTRNDAETNVDDDFSRSPSSSWPEGARVSRDVATTSFKNLKKQGAYLIKSKIEGFSLFYPADSRFPNFLVRMSKT